MTSEIIDPFLSMYLMMMFLLLVFVIGMAIFSPSRSKRYRKVLADLYVAAKIRALAAEDGFNLADENEFLKKWSKKQRIEYTDLDNSIEEDLQERVAENSKTKKGKKAEEPKEPK